jgi:hypothetical protein
MSDRQASLTAEGAIQITERRIVAELRYQNERLEMRSMTEYGWTHWSADFVHLYPEALPFLASVGGAGHTDREEA